MEKTSYRSRRIIFFSFIWNHQFQENELFDYESIKPPGNVFIILTVIERSQNVLGTREGGKVQLSMGLYHCT